MRRTPRPWLAALSALALAAATGACATTGAAARPAAFPRAPRPPAAVRPPPLEAPRPVTGSDLIRTAFGLRGIVYRFGGESPAEGFDCSGFVRYVFGLYDVDLPRTVSGQYVVGSKVPAAKVREGDLVFFSTIAPGASHVGLALGDGAFIHAPGEGGEVRIDRLDAPYWHVRIVGVKRVL